MRGWEHLLNDDAMPSSPRKRLEYFDKKAPGIDGWAATILQVIVNAEAADRARKRTLAALKRKQTVVALGEANNAVLSLFLAARAAQVYSDGSGEANPFGDTQLRKIVATLRQMRDCVMHWEDKADSSPAYVAVTDHDLLIVGRVGKPLGPSVPAGMPWDMFETWTRRLRVWGDAVMVEDLGLPKKRPR